MPCLEMFSIDFHKNPKYHGNPFSGSRVGMCEETDGHDETNNAFRDFGEGSKISLFLEICVFSGVRL